MKTKKILTIIATIWLMFIIMINIYYTLPSLLESIMVIIILALPSWILFLIALKFHMGKKSIFSWGKI